MTTKANDVRDEAHGRDHKRYQVNLVLTEGSPTLAKLREAEHLTGQTPTKILRSLIDSRLSGWLQEEIDQRRQLGEIARRAERAHVPVQQLGRQRPRYRGEDGIHPGYAAVAAMRTPVGPKVVTRHENVAVKRVQYRPSGRPMLEPITVDDDDIERL